MSVSEIVAATVRIAASPTEVFPYFIDPALMVEWIGDWADLEPEAGGLFALNVGNEAVRGHFVAIEPPSRVVFTWGVPGSAVIPPGSTTVEIVLTADGAETVVELFHRDLPPEQQAVHKAGWTTFLGRLVEAFRS